MASKLSFNVKIEEIKKLTTHDLDYGYLVLKFSGSDVNELLMNTLRRVVLNNIPTHAFAPECIQIEENTSVFNNDQMRLRLMQLPLYNIPLDLHYLEDEYWLNVNYAAHDRIKHPQEKQIEIYISATNNDENIKYITTNDLQFYENNIRIESGYNKKYPIVLIKLRPRETFKCKMKAVLGTGESNIIWAGAGNAYYTFDETSSSSNERTAIFTIESHGQFDEYELLWKACKYMQSKLIHFKKIIADTYETMPSPKSPTTIELTFDNESHTIGNMLTETLQLRPDVIFAGFGKLNELVKQITIVVKYENPLKDPLAPIMESIDVVVGKMKALENMIHPLMNTLQQKQATKKDSKK